MFPYSRLHGTIDPFFQVSLINSIISLKLIQEPGYFFLFAHSLEIQNLKQEIEELKKTKADTHLKDFDVITKREAHEIPDKKV